MVKIDMVNNELTIPKFFQKVKTPHELRFVEYLGVIGGEDIHLAKMRIDNGDGTFTNKTFIIKNYEMPFWVTVPIYRKHTQKKEYEKLDRMVQFWTTEEDKVKNGVVRLGLRKDPRYSTYRDVSQSPYIYGMDISASSYIKEWFIENGASSPWDYVTLDTEANIEDPNNEYTTHISISSKDKSYLAVLRSVFHKLRMSDDEIREAIKADYIEHVPNGRERWHAREREIELFDDFPDMLETTFAVIHKWNPDILGIWNSTYDIEMLIKQYEGKYGRSMARLFKNPEIDDKYAVFRWNPGRIGVTTKMDNGKTKNKTFKPNEIWNNLVSSAGFKTVCAMRMFYQLRSQTPDIEGGFGLDNVGTRIAKSAKIHDDSPYKGREWHIRTHADKPIFYSIYSINDGDMMHDIENKVQDMTVTGPTQLGSAEWLMLNSLPKRLHVAFHFFILRRGYAVGTFDTSFTKPFSKMTEKEKEEYVRPSILGTGRDEDDDEGWIVTLPSHRILGQMASKIIAPELGLETSHFGHVYDNDEVSAYPRATVCGNISLGTTKGELISIGDMKLKGDFLRHNINLVANKTNSLVWAQKMLKMPGVRDVIGFVDNVVKDDLTEEYIEFRKRRRESFLNFKQSYKSDCWLTLAA